MIFGRGGVGGVINRVTRQAEWTPTNEISLQGGSWDDRRVTGDFGRAFGDTGAMRITSMYETSDSYRKGADLKRYGINPTFSLALGDNTLLRGGFEHFHDARTADRGVSSFAGRPVTTDASTFFGNPDVSDTNATVNLASASLDHRFNDRVTLRSRSASATTTSSIRTSSRARSMRAAATSPFRPTTTTRSGRTFSARPIS